MPDQDTTYRELLLTPLRKCADFTPKFGGGASGLGLELAGFQALYGADPLYSWMGFDSPLMYAAHKAAGGMTSLYRQLGIGCERLFRAVIRDNLGLTDKESRWEYELAAADGGVRRQALDGRIDLRHLPEGDSKDRVTAWLGDMQQRLHIETEIVGAVFEIRQGYKSKDSKRQNADLANAAKAISVKYLPVLTVISAQLDGDLRIRYQVGKWGVLAGTVDRAATRFESTFTFSTEILGYDLRAFFERNVSVLRDEVGKVLRGLLEAK
jgi:hypothetical protein